MEQNKFNLGKKIYFIDFIGKKVNEGEINSISISSSGYAVYSVIIEGKAYSLEKAIIFDTLEEAEAKLPYYLKTQQEMIDISKDAEDRIQALRVSIIGQPDIRITKDDKSI